MASRAGGDSVGGHLDPMMVDSSSSSLPRGEAAVGAATPLMHNDETLDSVSRLLLPAQGALFVTNYRVIFIGVPRDPFRKLKSPSLNLNTQSHCASYPEILAPMPSSWCKST